MGLTKVFGAIFIFASVAVGIVNTFLFWNSSAFFNYNTGENMGMLESMSQNGILIPYIICFIIFTVGFLLARDHVLEEAH